MSNSEVRDSTCDNPLIKSDLKKYGKVKSSTIKDLNA